jgi:hypothetical protein
MAELLDFSKLAIGGVALIPLIIGLVEFAKTQGLQGRRWFMMLAFILGILFAGMAQAISEGLIPVVALAWVRVAVVAIGGAIAACAAMGLYDLVDKRTIVKQ